MSGPLAQAPSAHAGGLSSATVRDWIERVARERERTAPPVDADDREVPTGQPGEVAVRGPTVFSGYWQADEINAEDFRGGTFHPLGRLAGRLSAQHLRQDSASISGATSAAGLRR